MKKIWRKATYQRGGTLHTKWGTTFKRPLDYRDRNSGVVVTPSGRILGVEPTNNNKYGHDPHKKKGLKKPAAFVRTHARKGAPVRSHVRRLR